MPGRLDKNTVNLLSTVSLKKVVHKEQPLLLDDAKAILSHYNQEIVLSPIPGTDQPLFVLYTDKVMVVI